MQITWQKFAPGWAYAGGYRVHIMAEDGTTAWAGAPTLRQAFLLAYSNLRRLLHALPPEAGQIGAYNAKTGSRIVWSPTGTLTKKEEAR